MIPPVVIVVVCFGLFLFAGRIQIKSLSSHPNYREIELFFLKELIKTGMKVKFQERADKASSPFPT